MKTKRVKEVQLGFAFREAGQFDRGSLDTPRVIKSSPVHMGWAHEIIDRAAWQSDRDLLDMQCATHDDWMERERLANIERRNRAALQG